MTDHPSKINSSNSNNQLEDTSGIDVWTFNITTNTFSAPLKKIGLSLGYYSEALPTSLNELLQVVFEEDIEKVKLLFTSKEETLQSAFRLKTHDDRIAWVGINGSALSSEILVGIAYLIDHSSIVDATLKSVAFKDPLTGLGNRSKLYQLGSMEIERAKRYDHKMSLMVLDIDNFKETNATYGHVTGDKIIRSVADSINDIIRHVDLKIRFDGDEFVILLLETDKYESYVIAERLRKEIEKKKHPVVDPITITIGIAELNSSDDVESLLNRADQAMVNAKKHGINTTQLSR